MVKMKSRLLATLGHLLLVDKAVSEALKRGDVENAAARHALKRNHELAIQLIYTHLNEYLRSVLGEMYDHNPLLVVGKASGSLQFHEIISMGTFENVSRRIVDSVFRTLEAQRSTKLLVDKILDKTSVNLDGHILADATYYLEIRHLIVHNSSFIDEKFEKKYGDKFKYAKMGNKLLMSQGMARKAVSSIERMCFAIDVGLIKGGHIQAHPDLNLLDSRMLDESASEA